MTTKPLNSPVVLTPGIETYWTVPQVAARLHVTDECVKKWLVRGRLPRTKAGKRTLVTESHLQAFIRESTLAADGAPDAPIADAPL